MGKKRFVKEYLEPIITAIIIALFIRTFVVQAFKIPSSSMEPTLLVGDHILVNKFIYGPRIPYSDKIFGENKKFFEWRKPKRGDVIVFMFPGDPSKDYIKRVIGTEGEKVEIIGKSIYINDKLINDPWGRYINPFARDIDWPHYFESPAATPRSGPFYVPKDSLFVMGDNRNNSADSRFWHGVSYVNLSAVKGKAFLIYFSWNQNSDTSLDKVRWGRIGKVIH